MNDKTLTGSDENTIAELLKLAGPRAEPPVDVAERVRAGVRAHWQQRVSENRRAASVRNWRFASAAALVIALTGTILWLPRGAQVPTSAQVVNLAGSVDIERASTDTPAGTLDIGDRLRTGDDGGAILVVASGHELRVDRETRIALLAGDRIEVSAGAVYIDSRDGLAAGSLHVVTPFGTARDVGTRFAVRVVDDAVEVLVRDGTVELIDDRGDRDWRAEAGQGLRRSSAGEAARFTLTSWDERWRWTRALASFELDGASAGEYLSWLAREQGLTLRYADELAMNRARESSSTSGEVGLDGWSMEDSLHMVLRTSELASTVQEGELIVSVAEETP